jgi:hypothetical protein
MARKACNIIKDSYTHKISQSESTNPPTFIAYVLKPNSS